MQEKILNAVKILIILFLGISLLIAVMAIWDVMSLEVAKEALTKVAYTFGAVFIVAILVIFMGSKKK